MDTTNRNATNTAALVAAYLQAIKAQRYTIAPQETALAIVAAGRDAGVCLVHQKFNNLLIDIKLQY